MRIAIFHNLPSGGAKRHTREQARELSRRGHELVELTPGTADLETCSLAPYVSTQRVFPFAPPSLVGRIPGLTPYVHLVQGLALRRRLDHLQRDIAATIDREGFDIVLAQDCRLAMAPHLLPHLATPAAYFCHHGFGHWGAGESPSGISARARLAWRWYAPPRRIAAAAWQRDEIRSARAAGVLLTASAFAAAQVRRHYDREAELVGAGVDTERFAPTDGAVGDYVLSVGELTPRKQHGFLVAALARIPPPRRPRLLIAANLADPAETTAVRAQAAAADVALQIERITDDETMARAYRGARALVYAPRGEMLGLACLEAMSCGTPVVAVREGGVAETVVDGVTGWLTEREPGAFAARLDALLADDVTRRRMAAAGVEHVRTAWTWAAAGDRLVAALAREVEHRR